MTKFSQAPCVAIFDLDAIRGEVGDAFREEGWHVVEHCSTEISPTDQASPLSLAVFDPGRWQGARTWQNAPWRRSAAVIGAVDTALSEAELGAAGFDDWIRLPITANLVSKIAARWRPIELGPATCRIIDAFGASTIEPMLDRFALLLEDALEAIASGDSRPIAHRVAGVAGTLGFEALGSQWLAISNGDDTSREDARVVTRLAIGAILRRR